MQLTVERLQSDISTVFAIVTSEFWAQLFAVGPTVKEGLSCLVQSRLLKIPSTAKYLRNCYELLRLQGIRSTVTILFCCIFFARLLRLQIAAGRSIHNSREDANVNCNIQLQLSTAIVSRDRTLPMTEILNLVKECQSTVTVDSHSRQSQEPITLLGLDGALGKRRQRRESPYTEFTVFGKILRM